MRETGKNKNQGLMSYISDSFKETNLMKRLRDETQKDPFAVLQITPDQASFISFLIKLLGVENALELGTFTGYSALSIALALPDHGKLITCDISSKWTNRAKQFWEEAGVAHKIELKLKPALDSLDELIENGQESTFDFIFIDADKDNNDKYYEKALILLKQGGLIMIDNMFLQGAVFGEIIDNGPRVSDNQIQILRALKSKIVSDERVEQVLLDIADGLFLICKK